MYHRIGSTDADDDPWDLTVAPHCFEAQLEALVARRVALPLAEFARRNSEGSLPANAVALTFDDGYADNLLLAKPMLERFAVPATVFVSTGFLGKDVFWWDRYERIVSNAAELPPVLEIEIPGDKKTFTFTSANTRVEALAAVHSWLRDLTEDRMDVALEGLANALGSGGDGVRFRPMTHAELGRLPSECISVGAHTVSHPWLPNLSPRACTEEILDSVRVCEEVLGHAPTLFSYPYGACDQKSKNAVARCGLMAACLVGQRTVPFRCDPLLIPRMSAPAGLEKFLHVLAAD
jgi:peptidoglycan/xylan/chitin deacetylase (PgdA/CDA1 family)